MGVVATSPGAGHGARRTVAAVVLALLAMACGGGDAADDPSIDDPAGTGVEPSSDEEAAEFATDPDGDAGSEDPSEETNEDEGGVREHRPPEDAESFADCDRIDAMDPGARIAFPSADVDGSLAAGPGPVTVEVVGCGNTFEANVQWEAYHGQNATPTLEGVALGGTMGDWGAFVISETYWTPGDWTVVVFELDAESGERREYDDVTFTVE